jgi:radical SAM superfamily enzyme YgiQ (UPF0313 family)
MASEAYKTIRWEVSRRFSIGIANPYCFLGVLAHFGPSFFEVAHRNETLISPPVANDFCARHKHELKQLQRTFGETLAEKIRHRIEATQAPLRFWGVSCYDYTIFNSLVLARALKRMDPDSAVVFGGEAFDHQTASAVIARAGEVDAIVVGFGEEVLANVVGQYSAGHDVRRLHIDGLVNEESESKQHASESVQHDLAVLDQESESVPLQYVRFAGPNTLRIQTQRGCAWGKCTFCAYLGRNYYAPVSADLLAEQTRSAVEALKSSDRPRWDLFRVLLDSDECKAEHLATVLDNLSELKEHCEVLRVIAWVSVRDVNLTLLRAMANASEVGISVVLRANTESLNLQTLRSMRKGHFPLHALEVYKAAQDCGQRIFTNYFSWYPTETSKSVKDEVCLLKRVAHLLGSDRGCTAVGAYEANTRDTVSQHASEYEMRFMPATSSPWMEEAFGLKIPFGIYGVPVKSCFPSNANELASLCFLRSLHWDTTRLPSFVKNGSRSHNNIAFWFYWHSHRMFWSLLNRVCHLVYRSPYAERLGVLRHFETGFHSVDSRATPSSFSLVETSNRFELRKSVQLPGSREEWTRRLDDTEVKVLRYLYWYRKRRDVLLRFRDEMEKSAIESLLDRHLQLGSLVGIGDNLLSVFHDPGWWRDGDAVAEGEQLKRLA